MESTLQYIIKKYNINVGRQYFIDIPQLVGSTDLAKLFAELGYKVGAEIGTDQGLYAEYMLKTIPNLVLHCIDPWMASAYEKGAQPESYEDQKFFTDRFNETVQRLDPYNAIIHRNTSEEALRQFEDNSLDFVYIDGNHDFLNVTFDIHHWLKKVRPGGILAGHDYVRYPSSKFNHVKKVVQSYFPAYNLLPVFAVMQNKRGMKRDLYRSWFYVKQ